MGRVAIYLGALTVVFVILTVTTLAWFPRAQTSAEVAAGVRRHVERNFARLLSYGGPDVAASAEFVHTDCDCGRDIEGWVMIRVPPAAVARIRQAVMKEANRGGYRSVRTMKTIMSDGALLRDHANHRPKWWKPTKLAGAEIIAVGDVEGSVYVFSEATGTIYAMTWTV